MSFLMHCARYLKLLFCFGLCAFTINRRTNQINPLTFRQTTIYSILFATILLMCTLYLYEYFGEILKIALTTPSTISYVSEIIHFYFVFISCAAVIIISICERHKYMEIYRKIENLDIQLNKYLRKTKIKYTNYVQTIILPFFLFLCYTLFTNNLWLRNKTMIEVLVVYSIYTSIIALSLLHIRHLALELLKQYQKICINAKKMLNKSVTINYENYHKFLMINELLDTFNDTKILLNQIIGWTLVINYESDLFVITISMFGLIMYARDYTATNYIIKIFEMILFYALPYAIKIISAIKTFTDIGINQVIIRLT